MIHGWWYSYVMGCVQCVVQSMFNLRSKLSVWLYYNVQPFNRSKHSMTKFGRVRNQEVFFRSAIFHTYPNFYIERFERSFFKQKTLKTNTIKILNNINNLSIYKPYFFTLTPSYFCSYKSSLDWTLDWTLWTLKNKKDM